MVRVAELPGMRIRSRLQSAPEPSPDASNFCPEWRVPFAASVPCHNCCPQDAPQQVLQEQRLLVRRRSMAKRGVPSGMEACRYPAVLENSSAEKDWLAPADSAATAASGEATSRAASSRPKARMGWRHRQPALDLIASSLIQERRTVPHSGRAMAKGDASQAYLLTPRKARHSDERSNQRSTPCSISFRTARSSAARDSSKA
jgi:hypothetical protein